ALALCSGRASDRPVDPARGPRGNGALLYDQFVAIQQRRDRARDLLDLTEVGTPVVAWWRAHADKDDVGGRDRVLGSGREAEPARVEGRGQELRQTRLAYGWCALGECRDDLRILVDRGNAVAELSQTYRRDQAGVAGAENPDPHARSRGAVAGGLRMAEGARRRVS